MFGRVRVCACETRAELHVSALSCVHAEQRAPDAEKFGPPNISVVHSQNVARSEAVSTKIQHLLLCKTFQVHSFLWLSEAITCLPRSVAAWCMVLFPIALFFFHRWLRLSDPCSLSRSCLLSCRCSLLKLGDLSPTEVSQRSFKQIAKENFSMPLRDNYQTAQLPRSSHWVITFPRLLLFFPSNETISF